MKIKFGSLVIAGSGKIGGHVASRNRGGAYLRTKVSPSNPQTNAQLIARSLLSSLSSAWSGLTQEARNAWNNAVSQFSSTDVFGDAKNPSGINLFVKLNANLSNVGLAQLDLPPVKREVPFSTIKNAVMDLGDETLEIDFDLTTLDGEQVMVLATSSQSAGTNFVKNQFRRIGSYVVTGNVVGNTSTLFIDYVAKFGMPLPDANIKVRVVPIISTGQAGLPVQADVAVRA